MNAVLKFVIKVELPTGARLTFNVEPEARVRLPELIVSVECGASTNVVAGVGF